MKNKFRLSSNSFERESEEEKIAPEKIFFLSVEGNDTEKEYFKGISKYRQKLGINGRIDVEILSRSKKDTNSAPAYVLELLEEYLRLRKTGENKIIKEIPENFIQEYGEDFIQKYLSSSEELPKKKCNQFVTALRKIGYDINYRKYLSTYQNGFDEFGILIDRDSLTHSEQEILDCVQYCQKKGYQCFISNPCFEF